LIHVPEGRLAYPVADPAGLRRRDLHAARRPWRGRAHRAARGRAARDSAVLRRVSARAL